MCGACIWECPNEAISAGDPRPVVDQKNCTECYGFFGESPCIVVCPAKAIIVDSEPEEILAGRFRHIHPNRQPQDTWIWQRIDGNYAQVTILGSIQSENKDKIR